MSARLEPLFEFLFKHRPIVYEKGRLAFESGWPARLAILCALALGALALISYLRAGGRARPGDRVALLALRGLALLLVAFSLLRPTLVVSTVVPQQSFVGVLVDDSRSMQVADQDGRPRLDAARAALSGERGSLRAALEERFKLRLFRFGRGAARVADAGGLEFADGTTDLAGALELARQELRGVPLAGLVLLSDGADNGPGRLEEALVALKADGTPVHAVGFGSERFARDVEVVRVEAPRRVLKGSAVVASVWLAQRGLAGERVRLQVEDGGRIVHDEEIVLPAEGETAALRVRVLADEAGPRLLRFRVPEQPGEQMADNNARELLLDVADRRDKILYYEGELRYEPRFVRRALEQDPNLQIVTLLRTAENKYLRLDVDDAEELAAGFPRSREELYAYRGIVLGSVEASSFSAEQLRMLAEFVGNRGGGLLMLGGSRSFAEGGYAGTPVEETLPVLLEPPARERRLASLKVEATPYGLTQGVAQLADTEAASAERWRTLPELTAVNAVARTRPGAATLLTAAAGAGASQVVLAMQRYGRGRALAFTAQDSWLWRMHAEMPLEDRTHESLWRQLLRFLVSGVGGPVALTLPDEPAPPGASVALRAEVRDGDFLAVNDARVVARVRTPSGRLVEAPLEWSVERDGEYRGAFTADEAGFHEVKLEARRAGAELGTDVGQLRVAEIDRESFGAEKRTAVLERVARETGGRLYAPRDAAALAEDLRFSGGAATVVERKELWDMPALFLALLALLCIEWGYRKARGLA
jgi:uncharacterized membrane protein